MGLEPTTFCMASVGYLLRQMLVGSDQATLVARPAPRVPICFGMSLTLR
jgi:hypothetical protein